MKRASWSGQLAFVVAAAASAIGLGNLWRFPYLAAQYGGGAFIAIYIVLTVTLGFTLMISEITVGRLTRQSHLTAYSRLRRGWGFVGWLGALVPLLILPYYCVIGGWVVRYFAAYCQMAFAGALPMGAEAAGAEGFFSAFVASDFAPFGYGALFVFATVVVVGLGVKNGIERANLVLMPLLFALALAIAVYVICLPGTRDGLRYCLVPSLDALCGADGRFSFAQLGRTVLGAMGQMFYSLSLAMGIMVTYGSYMKRSDSIERSVRRIEFFDTAIAVVAALMIVPAVYMFAIKSGVTPELIAECGGSEEAARHLAVKGMMNAGPKLMFVTLPRVFATFGAAEAHVGLAFFTLVIFAALTSSISLCEAFVASVCDLTGWGRAKAVVLVGAVTLALSSLSAFGEGMWSGVTIGGQRFLAFFDFASNSVMMPLVAVATCVFIGWATGPSVVVDEVEAEGARFRAKGLYLLMVRYLAPLFVTAILVSEVCRYFGLGGWSI